MSDYLVIDYDALELVEPDLILAWAAGMKPATLARLETVAAVYVSKPRDFDDIAGLLRDIGALAGTAAAANRAADDFLARLAASRRTRPRAPGVLYLIQSAPPMTVNGGHWISAVIEHCGGRNVFADAPQTVVTLAPQALADAPVELLLHSLDSALTASFAARGVATRFLSAAWIQRPTPRLLHGIRFVCGALDALGAAPAAHAPNAPLDARPDMQRGAQPDAQPGAHP